MCGLAGYVGKGDQGVLEKMSEALYHRGPDAQGLWYDNLAGLTHTRLSIQDLSEAGAQPMASQDVYLAFNGEIYNCLLYTTDAADERSSVDLGGRRIIKKTNTRT